MATKLKPQASPTQRLVGSEGKRVAKPVNGVGLLSHEPTGDFLLMAHPGLWGIVKTDRGLELLPELGYFSRQAGIGGVRQGKRGQPVDDSGARAERQKKGWIVIEDDFVEGGYLRVHDTKHGADTLHCCVWERPMQAGGKPIMRQDDKAYWAFLRQVAAELLPPPVPEILEEIRDTMLARLSRQLEQAEQRPARAKAAVKTQARIDALTAVIVPEPPQAAA